MLKHFRSLRDGNRVRFMNGYKFIPAIARKTYSVYLDGLTYATQSFQKHLEIACFQNVTHAALVDRYLPCGIKFAAKVGFSGLKRMEFVGLLK